MASLPGVIKLRFTQHTLGEAFFDDVRTELAFNETASKKRASTYLREIASGHCEEEILSKIGWVQSPSDGET